MCVCVSCRVFYSRCKSATGRFLDEGGISAHSFSDEEGVCARTKRSYSTTQVCPCFVLKFVLVLYSRLSLCCTQVCPGVLFRGRSLLSYCCDSRSLHVLEVSFPARSITVVFVVHNSLLSIWVMHYYHTGSEVDGLAVYFVFSRVSSTLPLTVIRITMQGEAVVP